MQALEAEKFLGKDGDQTLFHIENCTRAADICDFSAFAQEVKVLLLHGTYLEVVNVGDMGHGLAYNCLTAAD